MPPMQTGGELEERRPDLSVAESELDLPFDLRKLKEMLPVKAKELETNGSFYAGTLEREWVYRKLCEPGFLGDDVKRGTETKRKAFQENGEAFSFEQTFQKLSPEAQEVVELLSRALSLAEAGILSEEELKEFEERLRSGGADAAFLSKRQHDARVSFLKAFPSFAFYDSKGLEKCAPLHVAFLQLFPNQNLLDKTIEERYLCTLLGSLVLPRAGEKKEQETMERVRLLSHKEMTALDAKLAALNTIRRAHLLGVITSQAHADALVEGVRRNQ